MDHRPPARLALHFAFALALAAVGCGSAPKTPSPTATALGPDEIPLSLTQRCPGDPDCLAGGDGQLYVGAAKRDITPLVEPFVDENGNGVHDANEPYSDLNGNGKFDPVWIAGRDSGTAAWGVHDPLWMRCWVVRQNQTTVAHCVLDAIGYFYDEVEQIRADLDPALGVDLVMVSATHDHQAKDTIGIWGSDDFTSGYDPIWMARVRAAAVEAITESVRNLKMAKMSIGSILTEAPNHDMTHYISDTRDPVVIDDRLHVLQFDGASDGKPIVTIVNWACHPDNLGSKRHLLSSDFVHYLREGVEAGTGSECIYVNGAQGGQIGGGRVVPLDEHGKEVPNDHTFHSVAAWGNEMARMTLQAWAARKPVENPQLAFRTSVFEVHVENVFYHTAALLGLFHKQFFGYDHTQPLLGANTPITRTEVAFVTLGPASIVTAPGELLPELFLGGYDGSGTLPGSHSGIWPLFDPTQPNPPDLTQAPKAPYLFDELPGDPEHRMVFGLTFDMLGYIIARFNFILDDRAPYVARAPGDHYEETNSIGPRAEPEIVGTLRQLVESAR